MRKVKLTITESKCRGGYCKKGDEFIIEDLCPPLCHEFWNTIYPFVYALLNGAELDYGNGRSKQFDAKCPDGGRVCIHGEVIKKVKKSKSDFLSMEAIMEVKVFNNISDDNINRLIEWSNARGPDFLEQWAGKNFHFPLVKAEVHNIRESVYSIFCDDEFVGIIQRIRQEGPNIHIGRFVLNPDTTGKGIGKIALQKFCDFLFNNFQIQTISLNVFDYNVNAFKLYQKIGFQVFDTVVDGNTTKLRMALKR